MNLGSRVKFFLLIPLVLMPLFFLSSCAQTNPSRTSRLNTPGFDPYETFNRKVFKFNMALSDAVLKPVVNNYNKTPSHFRTGVRNVYGNIMMFPTIGNDALQGNFVYLWRDLFRLTLNSTLGCLGLIDVASDAGFQPRTQSFSFTLAKWGIRQSPYLMLPFFGPDSVRGTFGFVPDYFMNPMSYIHSADGYMAARGGQLLQNAADVLPQEDIIMQMALDPYIAVRSAYVQNRAYLQNKVIHEIPDSEDDLSYGSSNNDQDPDPDLDLQK